MSISVYESCAAIADSDERDRVAGLVCLFMELRDMKTGRIEEMQRRAASLGKPWKTVRNKYYKWLEAEKRRAGSGAAAIADGRVCRARKPSTPIFGVFKTYCEKPGVDRKAAWRRMMIDFWNSEPILPGGRTWRDVWSAEHGGRPAPDECPKKYTPYGWTYSNLDARLANDDTARASLAWNQQGQFGAAKYVGDVLRSRYDAKTGRQLPAGAVYQWDDAWENLLVMARGKKGLFRPMGFHCYDVGTGYFCNSFMKPRDYTKVAGTDRVKGNNLTEQMFRMAFGYQMCVVGFHRDGVLNVQEKGTTCIRKPVQDRIAKIPGFGRLIHFAQSGAMNMPAHKGLFVGSIGGNPQFKSGVEGRHRIAQRAVAFLPGGVGSSAANAPEWLDAQKRYAEGVLAKVDLEKLPPDVLPLLRLPFLTFDQYMQIFWRVMDQVNMDDDHRLEGWVNYHVEEMRDPDSGKWFSAAQFDMLSPVSQDYIRAAALADPAHNVRSRRMSRFEAWESWKDEMVKVPLCEMQYFMDERDARELTVTDKRNIVLTDSTFYPGQKMVYDAVCKDRLGTLRHLAPGEKVRVYFNAWLPDHVWIADMEDKPIGMANLRDSAYWADTKHIQALAAQKLAEQAYLLQDTRSRHVDAAAQKLADETATRIFLTVAKEAAVLGHAPDGEGYSLDELAEAGGPRSVASDEEQGEESNADALAFLDAVNAV